MPLLSSCHAPQNTVRRRSSSSGRSQGIQASVRPSASCVGSAGPSRQALATAPLLQATLNCEASPCASPSKLISTAATSALLPPLEDFVTDADNALPIAVLTSPALAEPYAQLEGRARASSWPPSCGGSDNSLDDDSTAVSTLLFHTAEQQRPSVESVIDMSRGSSPCPISARRHSAPLFQNRATSYSASKAKGRISFLPSQHAGALPSPWSSSFSHLRPLQSSKEADYLNLAYQRSFLGRFRCATPVVIRTPAKVTLHENVAPATSDDSAPSHRQGSNVQKETTASSVCVSAGNVTGEGDHTSPSPAADGHTQGLDAEEPHPADVSSLRAVSVGHSSSLAAMGRPQRKLGCQRSVSGVSISSSGTTGRCARRGRSTSVINGGHPRGLLPSSASAVVRSTGATASAGLKARPFAGRGGLLPANMEPLVKSGLHTSLWLAQHDGGLEVRSMANPNQVLASLPRRDPQAIITSLTEVCGNRVVAGYTDGTLCVYDAITMKKTAELRSHTGAVTCLLYVQGAPRVPMHTSADTEHRRNQGSALTQSLLLTGSLDRSIGVWDAASMSYLRKLKGSLRSIGALAATATGGYAFSGSDDGTLRMWDVVQGEQLTIAKEERVNAVKRVNEMGLMTSAHLPQQLGVASTLVPAAAGQPSLAVPFSGLHRRDAEADGEVGGDRTPASSSRTFQHPLLSSAPRNSHVLAAPGAPRPSISFPVIDRPHHRSRKGSSAAKKRPRNRPTCAHEGSTTTPGSHLLVKVADGGSPVPSRSSFSFTPSAEVGVFETTEARTTSSSARKGGGMLAGLQGSIFGPHGGSMQGAAFEDEDDRRAVAGSAAGGDSLHRVTNRDPFSTPRTPRSLKRDIKKRAKCLQAKQHTGTTLTNRGRGAKKAKAKHPSPAPMVGVPPRREKGAPKRVTKTATLPTESTPTRTRRFGSSLEQRLESWLHLYQQRVLLSAASLQFTQRISAGYDTASTFSWPIECAHTECVTALTVVEDRLLVSASRDATAKVFALPSGQYVRTLVSSRRMPLSSVLYDPSVGRLYTAFVDGGLAVYDTHCAELPLLSQAQSPYTILSSTFVQLRMTPMRRFVWTAGVRGEETPDSSRHGNGGLSSVVMCAAQFDRTTMAHGPNQTATSYRVGQPSLRELNAAVSLQPLQQQRVLNLAKQAKQATHDMLEEHELSSMRRCGLILEREYVHRQSYCVFARWRQWAQRRELHSAFKGAVAARAESYAMALLARYRQRWLNWTRARKKMSASKVLQKVQLQASEVALLAVSNEVHEGYRRVWTLMADSMKRQQRITLLACAYNHWRDFLRARQAHVRQCVSFNQLLLSMNVSSSTPVSCTWGQLIPKAMQAATRSRALWLLTEKTQSSRAQAHRRRCFDLWRMCAQQRRRVTASAAESRKWGVVETLSASLVQPWKLRRRYFALWQDFALYVTRSERLASEHDTLGVLWATWQKTAENPISARKLQEKLSAAESSMAATEAEVKRLEARLKTVSSEVAVMRTEAALRMLIAGYRIPSVVQAAPLPSASTASAMTETSSIASLRRGSLASSASTGLSNGGGCSGAMAWCHTPKATGADRTEEERTQRQEEDKLLFEVSAVLRALKGKAMQYDRDDKLLSTAHMLALKLPIYEPAHHARASFESGAGRQATLSAQQQRVPRRRSSWSVSNVKSGGQIIVPAHDSSPPPQQQQPSYFVGDLTGSASLSVPTAALSSTSATTRNASSAVQMWAAQPAEETYTCLADAFTAVYVNLRALLHAAALECGAPAQRVSGMAGASAEDDLAGHVRASWITQVPLKQRRVMVGEVMKLVMLFDSFTAHNDLPVECAGSISKRGSVNTRAMPLCSLCSRDTATSLLENASVLLELVDPHLWSRQIKLNHLQDAYAAAIAELNTAVSSASFKDTVPRHSSAVTLSSAGTAEQGASPPPTPLQMRPSLLPLSEDVLQEAKIAMLKHDATKLYTTNVYRPLSIDRGTNRSPSSFHSGLTHSTPLSSAGACTPVRVHSTDGPLNVSNSLEEGSATPTAELRHLRHRSTSHHSYLGVQTAHSYTPRTATQLMAGAGPNGMLVKPYLGFRVNVNRETETMQRTTISIREVIPHYVNTEGEDVEGPAQVAGLQVGDQLVRFAGYAVTDLAAFNAVVSRHVHPGAELPVVILRSGEQLCKTIVVGSRATPGA